MGCKFSKQDLSCFGNRKHRRVGPGSVAPVIRSGRGSKDVAPVVDAVKVKVVPAVDGGGQGGGSDDWEETSSVETLVSIHRDLPLTDESPNVLVGFFCADREDMVERIWRYEAESSDGEELLELPRAPDHKQSYDDELSIASDLASCSSIKSDISLPDLRPECTRRHNRPWAAKGKRTSPDLIEAAIEGRLVRHSSSDDEDIVDSLSLGVFPVPISPIRSPASPGRPQSEMTLRRRPLHLGMVRKNDGFVSASSTSPKPRHASLSPQFTQRLDPEALEAMDIGESIERIGRSRERNARKKRRKSRSSGRTSDVANDSGLTSDVSRQQTGSRRDDSATGENTSKTRKGGAKKSSTRGDGGESQRSAQRGGLGRLGPSRKDDLAMRRLQMWMDRCLNAEYVAASPRSNDDEESWSEEMDREGVG